MIDKEGLNNLLNLGDLNSATTIIVFSEKLSARINYVCEFIFEHVLKIKCVLTSDINEFEASSFFRINYSDRQLNNSLQILPQAILFEKGVSENKPEGKIRNNLIYFYCDKESKDFHFDIFSSVFYFISRYEEWQHFEKDLHERFELTESILFKNKFHLKPVVEIWIEELKLAIVNLNHDIIFPKKEFKTIATIDVDNLYAYKSKGLIRTIGAGFKDLLRFDFTNLNRRIAVVAKNAVDPFDIYESFSRFCLEKKVDLIYFFLFKTGNEFDRTVNPESDSFTKVFETIKKNKAFIGLHPSYYSFNNVKVLMDEVSNFSEKLNSKVKLSRQHYLRYNIKVTPNLLLNSNILADFSMGFASGAGFRAGTSEPFYYYDLSAEEKTELLMVPFCAMDGAYFVYNKITSEEAYASLLKIREEIKKVNGLFITVFHERTFAQHLYPGFGEMYKKLLTSS